MTEVSIIGPGFAPVEGLLGLARHYEEVGYDTMFFADHLMGIAESIWTPDVTPLALLVSNPNQFFDTVASMAAVGTHTSRLRVGTSVTDLIRRHPAVTASAWLTLDHLTQGRVILGVGAGEAENLIPYGFDHSHPVRRMEEALQVIRALWENDGPVDHRGEFFTLEGAICGLSSFRPGRFPPIWLGSHGPRALDVTGRLADGWLPLYMPPDDYTLRRDVIARAAIKAGRDITSFTWAITLYVTLAENPEACEGVLAARLLKWLPLMRDDEFYARRGHRHPLGEGFRGIHEHIPTRYTRDETLAALDAVPRELVDELVVHGTPDDLLAVVRSYEAAGVDHFVFMDVTAYADPARSPASTALLEQVARELRASQPVDR